MPNVDSVVTIRTLGEVAWLASRVGRPMIDAKVEPTQSTLREFWQSIRKLQRSWTESLDELLLTSGADLAHLELLASQVFTTEMAARVWSTILAGIDHQTGREDLTRIARNAVNGLLQVRNLIASKMLSLPSQDMSKVAELDRLRRRCDRWTDLLIGNIIGRDGIVEFAFSPERALDFAQETEDFAPCSGPNPVEHLVTAGLRLGLLGQLPNVELKQPAFQEMIQSILGSIPQQAFHQDGSLIESNQGQGLMPIGAKSVTETSADDVLIPGITFAQMRRRFR